MIRFFESVNLNGSLFLLVPPLPSSSLPPSFLLPSSLLPSFLSPSFFLPPFSLLPSPSLLSPSPTRERKTFYNVFRNIGSQPSTGTKTITMETKSTPWVTTDNGSEYNRKREMQLPSLHKRERTRGYRQLILRISHKYMYIQCAQWSVYVLTVRCFFLKTQFCRTNSLMLVCKVWPRMHKPMHVNLSGLTV